MGVPAQRDISGGECGPVGNGHAMGLETMVRRELADSWRAPTCSDHELKELRSAAEPKDRQGAVHAVAEAVSPMPAAFSSTRSR